MYICLHYGDNLKTVIRSKLHTYYSMNVISSCITHVWRSIQRSVISNPVLFQVLSFANVIYVLIKPHIVIIITLYRTKTKIVIKTFYLMHLYHTFRTLRFILVYEAVLLLLNVH